MLGMSFYWRDGSPRPVWILREILSLNFLIIWFFLRQGELKLGFPIRFLARDRDFLVAPQSCKLLFYV